MSVQYTPPELSEDCLYLNVYSPAEAAKGDNLPVGWGDSVYLVEWTNAVMLLYWTEF